MPVTQEWNVATVAPATPATCARTVLFLCTGNYYRSRFAEILFNHLSRMNHLEWHAESRGLALELGVENVGPISHHAMHALRACGVPMEDWTRLPMQATVGDFRNADIIVALKEAEHRPMIARRFPGWQDRVEYWHVHDMDQASPAEALGEVRAGVEQLILRVQQTTQIRSGTAAPALASAGAK
jgi:protein-tyrosine phosphatase